MVQKLLSKKAKNFLQFFLYFFHLHKILLILKKKDQLYSLNIWEVTDPDICGYFNASKFLF